MPSYFFYFFAAILIFSCLAVVFARNPMYNVLSLVVAIFSLSSIFILLEAYFVGIILLLVYAGAVLIFFLFLVMCLNLNADALTNSQQTRFWTLGTCSGLLMAATIITAIRSYAQANINAESTLRGTIEIIGKVLFTDYLLPFELTSMLLLIAIFGIVALAQGALSGSKESA